MLLKRIFDLVFSKRLRIQGWTQDHIICFKKLLWAHAVQYEELYGVSACCENVEYSLHMPEDIQRHSLLDNYWCYLYERLVKYYKQQSSNMKKLCKTFADRAAQLQFVNMYLQTNDLDHDPSQANNIDLQSAILLSVSSVDAALKLKSTLCQQELITPEVKRCLDSGIFLGKATKSSQIVSLLT